MINGLEGIPGSGKSYEAVAFHVLPTLQQGRKIVTNLPLLVDMFAAMDPSYRDLIELRHKPGKVLGRWDADAVDAQGNGNAFQVLPDFAQEPASDATAFGTVWCYYSTWKHPETGQGPLFIIDECHVALPTIGSSKEVVEWFKLHRHFNADVLLMTQSFRDINQPIARLMAMLVICRKADILGHADHYIRKVKAGYRGAVISTEERKYNPAFFGLYRSHTQGNSVAESMARDVSPLLVKVKRFTWGFWIFTAIVIAWMFWPSGEKKEKQKPATPVPAVVRTTAQASQLQAPGEGQGGPFKPAIRAAPEQLQPAQSEDAIPEPYASKSLHLVGRIAMGGKTLYMFVVSDAGRTIASLDHRDLIAAGYAWEPLTDCAGTLRWGKKVKAITCDAPIYTQGSQDRPVVIESGQRSHAVFDARGGSDLRPFPNIPDMAVNTITLSQVIDDQRRRAERAGY